MRCWAAYRRRHGQLDGTARIERAVARLTAIYANTHRKPGTEPMSADDFLPHAAGQAETLEQAMATWH